MPYYKEKVVYIKLFVPNAPFLYPLMFSGGKRKGALGANGLILKRGGIRHFKGTLMQIRKSP